MLFERVQTFDKTNWKPSSLPGRVVESASFKTGTSQLHGFTCYTIPTPNCSTVSRPFYSAFVTARELVGKFDCTLGTAYRQRSCSAVFSLEDYSAILSEKQEAEIADAWGLALTKLEFEKEQNRITNTQVDSNNNAIVDTDQTQVLQVVQSQTSIDRGPRPLTMHPPQDSSPWVWVSTLGSPLPN